MPQKCRKARKGNFGELKSKKCLGEHAPQTPLVVRNQSVFIQTTSALTGPLTISRLLDSTFVVPRIELCMIVLFEWLFTLTNRL